MIQPILVVDDDAHIREVVIFALEKAGFSCAQASDGKVAMELVARHLPSLIILDIAMPEMDGLELCKQLRKHSDVPILFLSARDEEIDKVVGFEIGADDYVTKPFSPRELVARVQAILKRTQNVSHTIETNEEHHLQFGRISMHLDKHEARYHDQQVELTAKEFAILQGFLHRPEHVFDRNRIIDLAYGPDMHVSDRTIDSHIRHIRKKFAGVGCADVIETVHGVGYKLCKE